MTTKHTPGPWVIDKSQGAPEEPEIRADKGSLLVATVYHQRFDNAPLISAAPDLLAACEAVLAFEQRLTACRVDGGRAVVDSIKAAIAKAKGE